MVKTHIRRGSSAPKSRTERCLSQVRQSHQGTSDRPVGKELPAKQRDAAQALQHSGGLAVQGVCQGGKRHICPTEGQQLFRHHHTTRLPSQHNLMRFEQSLVYGVRNAFPLPAARLGQLLYRQPKASSRATTQLTTSDHFHIGTSLVW